MQDKTKSILLRSIGIILILFAVASFANQIYLSNLPGVLWFCYIGLLIMGIGCLKNSENLILSQIYILAIPTLIWNLDFFVQLLTKYEFLGITSYFFEPTHSLFDKIISLQHIISLPLGIYAAILAKKRNINPLKFSIFQIFALFFLTLIPTPKNTNINCIREPCFNIHIPIPYVMAWFLGFILMIIIAHLITKKLESRKSSSPS